MVEPLCNFDLRHNPGEIRIQTYANLNGEGLKPSQIEGETYIDGARVEVCHLCKSRCPRHEELFVQEAEILLNNGVAYVIDSIIVRNSAVTQPSNSRRRNTNLFEIIR
ncbi:hypothetical protein OESDEN_21780 [Oesophagostomum dentatum]|uniref:Uncharacterized protein n=1 Tax=Oesophagostomum dentatum TaxID=61180 RepID=A0A0B1S544_OESDE|nr:hypothetical protein OESDEN_21780 [Oesophagostomum dentatum]